MDKLPVENYRAGFKMVDTCAAEFSANTPYFYSTYDGDNEAAEFIAEKEAKAAEKGEPRKKKVLVFGSGPIRIGQGIEFDYCSVHCVWTLKKHGCEAILVNNNPETVSTDFDTGDRLYFDPLNPESVDNIIATEKPDACVVQFGGQTASSLQSIWTRSVCPSSAPRRMPSTRPKTVSASMSCWRRMQHSPVHPAALSSIWKRLWPQPTRSVCLS